MSANSLIESRCNQDQTSPPLVPQTTLNEPADYQKRLVSYNIFISQQLQQFHPQTIDQTLLQKHNITLTRPEDFPFLTPQEMPTKRDCLFAVIKSQNYGFQYTYDIFLGPFRLRVLVLNLQRNSDDNDEQISRQQLGFGGFGNVRAVRINNLEFAIKRIPFQFRLTPLDHYDYQAQKGEQSHLHHCLRQYCVYKICSLIGAGPCVVFSSYDVICFNNCIEFCMQICQAPIKNHFPCQQVLPFEQIQRDLSQKLALMHDVGFVHRDIKPQNVLYSPKSQSFVYGDFGMTMLLKQDCRHKTLTKFAGTPNYCGLQMKQLQNTGREGWVNLYLNDYQSLELTLDYFQKGVVKEGQQISRNNMSYMQQNSGGYYENGSDEGMNSFGEDSMGIRTDSSFVPTPTARSILTSVSNTTQAPKRYASSINHHLSSVIFRLCRRLQSKMDVSAHQIDKACTLELIDREKEKEIFNKIYSQVLFIFRPEQKQNDLGLIGEWKNASRHHGPTNQHTLNLLTKIIERIEEEDISLIKIREELQLRGACIEQNIIQMKLLKKMRHFRNYADSLVSLMRYEIAKQKHLVSNEPANNLERPVFIAQEYLFCIRNPQTKAESSAKLTQLLLLYFSGLEEEPSCQSADPIDRQIHCVNFCLKYLRSHQAARQTDIANFCYYHIDFSIPGKRVLNLEEIKLQLQDIQKKTNQFSHIRVKMLIASLYLRLLEYYGVAFKQTAILKLQQLLILTQVDYERLTVCRQLSEAYIYLKQYEKSLQISLLNYQLAQQIRMTPQLKSRCLAGILSSIGYCYFFKSEYQLSIKYLSGSLQNLLMWNGPQVCIKIVDTQINISEAYRKLQQPQNSRVYLLRALSSFSQNPDAKMTHTKLSIYQSLVQSYLIQGSKNAQDYNNISYLVNQLVDQFKKSVSKQVLMCKPNLVNLQHPYIVNSDRIFIHKQIIKRITPRNYRRHFPLQYQYISYELSHHYLRELKHINEGLKHLWRYIQSRMEGNVLTENDYQVMNMFAQYLMKSNSSRRAGIFLKKYVFKLPVPYVDTRKKAFVLMLRAQEEIGEKMARVYRQIIRNNCQILTNKNFTPLFKKEDNLFKRKLLEKWVCKL